MPKKSASLPARGDKMMPRPPARACRASGTCCSSSGPGRAVATAAAPAATRAATASWARGPRLAASSTSSTVFGATGAWRAQNPLTSAPSGGAEQGRSPSSACCRTAKRLVFPLPSGPRTKVTSPAGRGSGEGSSSSPSTPITGFPCQTRGSALAGTVRGSASIRNGRLRAAAGGGVPAAAVINWQTPPSPPIRPWTSALPGTGSIGGSRGQLIKVSGPAPVGRWSLLASSGRNRLLASSRSPVMARTTPVAWPSRAMSCTQSSAQPSRPDRKPLSQRPHPLTSRTNGTPAAVSAGSGADARAPSREETSLARRRRTRAARSTSSGPT